MDSPFKFIHKVVFVSVFSDVLFQCFSLLNQMLRKFVVNIVKQALYTWEFDFFAPVKGVYNLFSSFSPFGILLWNILVFDVFEEHGQSFYWVILFFPFFSFVFLPVEC